MQNPDNTRRLDTKQAAAFLSDLGYDTAPATLCKYRCVGGGPVFELFGRKPLYTGGNLLAWVHQKTSDLRRSTSDNGSSNKFQQSA